jgi:sulfate adenylyltransferase subunit 1 (EFTu-like GTPase family)
LSVGLLRFLTAGSVDDGKSTLIGRMLVDARGAFEDQVSAATRDNERRGGKGVDFSLLTDGLKAERRQGIKTSPIDTSQQNAGSSSLPTRQATNSTRATW